MAKKQEEMIGTPPAERLRFSCKRYKPGKLNGVGFKDLVVLTEKAKTENTRHPDWVMAGVVDFLNNTTFTSFEGRTAGRVVKDSFSVPELETALSFKEDRLKIEYLVYRYMFTEYSARKIVSNFPIVVAIEPTSLCNLRCTMCFQADETYFNRSNHEMGFMDMGLYKNIIDEMAENQPCSLVFASRGEPLLHPKFTEMVAYASAKGIIDIKINTNATALTEKKSRELLQAEPTTVVFSVDAGNKKEFEAIRIGANFDRVVANIKRFNEIRESEFPNSPTRTRISMTVFRQSQDPKEAEQLWAPIVDEFAIHSADYRLDIYAHPLLPDEIRPCSLLWERVYVWWDGVVNPCDIDYKSNLSLGQVDRDNTIKLIWRGEKMQAMRGSHLSGLKNNYFPCNQCYGPGF